ncbi:MAG: ABC transporter ATP-binding protein [Gemmatimonadaceae bacterium]
MTASPFAVETRGLTRAFGRHLAVDRVDLCVPRGAVYGFLGPNGAGKTTTIRLVLGLLSANSGELCLNGERFTRSRRDLLRHVGALVEGPSLYPHLTGEENLEVTRRLLNLPRAQVDEVLDRFGLTAVRRRLVRAYSTGMRQLLGLARAWMTRPSLLVLDEPANGLDPGATRTLRALLRETTNAGSTVLVSSHVLAEVEQVADHVGVIHHGRLLFQGELAELKARGTGTLEDIFLELVTSHDAERRPVESAQ